MPFSEAAAGKFIEAPKPTEIESPEIIIDFGSAEKSVKGEDSSMANEQVIAVADGVGSIKGGEVASNLAILEMFTMPDLTEANEEEAARVMRDVFDRAQSQITEEYSQYHAMGAYEKIPLTTLSVMALFDNKRRAVIGNIGDSSVCRLREGKIERLTPEDTWLGIFENAGIKVNYDESDRESLRQPLAAAIDPASLAEAEKTMSEEDKDEMRRAIKKIKKNGMTVNEARNNVTTALGSVDRKSGLADITPHIFTVDVQPGDVYLAFTDGLDKKLRFPQIGEMVDQNQQNKTAKEIADLLAKAGVDNDDTSVAVLMVD